MPKILMPYTVHLDNTLRVTPVSTLFYKGDSKAHRFELNVLSKGLQADLSGCTAVYRFYRLQDSTVVSNPASIENGKVVAVLDKACYDYIGRFALTIAIQNGEDETTVFYGDGYMSGNRADTGITGDYVVYDVETLLAKIAEIETAIANANTAIANANTAAENANAAEENANAAASGAQSAAGSANDAASAANTAAGAANSAASSAQTATQNANAATQASQTQQEAVAKAEAARDTAEQGRQDAEQTRQETFAGYEERIVAATPDDTTVDGRAWTSKKTVDSLCMPLEATGNPVQVYPVEGYPLGVRVSWEPVQEGSGDPSPDNIRPIVGWDSVNVNRAGKNLLNLQGAKEYAPAYGLHFAANSDGSIRMYGTVENTSEGVSILDFRTVIVKGITDLVKKTGCNFKQFGLDTSAYIRIDETSDTIVFSNVMLTKGETIDINVYVMGYIGDAPTAYEPYTGSTTDITLPETVYGGTLDVETGVVTVEYVRITLTGKESWTLQKVEHEYSRFEITNIPKLASDRVNQKSTHYKLNTALVGTSDTGFFVYDNGPLLMVGSSGYVTVDEFKAYLADQYAAGTPVQMCYKVKDPDTIQLDRHQIAALSGVNTIYTDAGTLTVTGREDPRHTIVKLTDRIAALESAAAGV